MSYRFVNTSGGPVTLPVINVDVPIDGVNDIGDELDGLSAGDIATIEAYVQANGHVTRDSTDSPIAGLTTIATNDPVNTSLVFYVDQTGDDANDGLTALTPFATFARAMQEFLAPWSGDAFIYCTPGVHVVASSVYNTASPVGDGKELKVIGGFTDPILEGVATATTDITLTDTGLTGPTAMIAGAHRHKALKVQGKLYPLDGNDTDTFSIRGDGAGGWAQDEPYELVDIATEFQLPEAMAALTFKSKITLYGIVVTAPNANVCTISALAGALNFQGSRIDMTGVAWFASIAARPGAKISAGDTSFADPGLPAEGSQLGLSVIGDNVTGITASSAPFEGTIIADDCWYIFGNFNAKVNPYSCSLSNCPILIERGAVLSMPYGAAGALRNKLIDGSGIELFQGGIAFVAWTDILGAAGVGILMWDGSVAEVGDCEITDSANPAVVLFGSTLRAFSITGSGNGGAADHAFELLQGGKLILSPGEPSDVVATTGGNEIKVGTATSTYAAVVIAAAAGVVNEGNIAIENPF